MSLKIDEYLSSCGAVSEMMRQQSAGGAVSATETGETDTDSYISTMGSSVEAIPCENYNDILQVMRNAEAGQSGASTEEADQSGTVSAAGGGSSDSEEETTTEVVVIDGVTYLETTTVIDGVTSVERTVISGQNSEKEVDDNPGNERD